MPLSDKKKNLNFKILLNSRKSLLLAILLVWATVFMIFFGIKPQIEAVFEINGKLDEEKQQFQKVSIKLNELKQIKISDQFKQKDKVDEVLPSHKPVLELLFNLQQTAQTSQASIVSLLINPGKIATESAELELIQTPATSTRRRGQPAPTVAPSRKRFDSLQMELVVRGTQEQIDLFIKTIERITPFTSIVELSIRDVRRGQRDEAETRQEATLVLNTYYYTQVISTSIDSILPTVGEKELRAFNTIMDFVPSEYTLPTEIRGANIEDFFNIEGFKFN